jgi:peptidyl-prolyl cis-trans isomerase A (cyclophilin A)
MSRVPILLGSLALAVAGCGSEKPAGTASAANASAPVREATPLGDLVRVRIATEAGDIVVELDHGRAPVTTENFVRYVDEHRFDGTTFYRASRTRGAPERGFVQGGIRRSYRRMLPPIAHEPTSATGLRHLDGTISMARSESGAGAMGDFFITVGAMPAMDAAPGEPGYAAFGRVVEGMDVVRHILAAPTVPNAGRGAMRGQMLAAPIAIRTARRLDRGG